MIGISIRVFGFLFSVQFQWVWTKWYFPVYVTRRKFLKSRKYSLSLFWFLHFVVELPRRTLDTELARQYLRQYHSNPFLVSQWTFTVPVNSVLKTPLVSCKKFTVLVIKLEQVAQYIITNYAYLSLTLKSPVLVSGLLIFLHKTVQFSFYPPCIPSLSNSFLII